MQEPAASCPSLPVRAGDPGVPGLPHVSIVVPVYNERDNLRPLHAELARVMELHEIPYEVIFIDDGSTDGSTGVLSMVRASDRRCRVLSLAGHMGQTAAISAGFDAARGDVVITMDADLQNDPQDIPRLIEELEGNDAVVGWRAARRDPWLRRASSRVGNAVRNLLSGDDFLDTGCSLKAYRRAALRRIKLYDGMHRFLPTLLRLEGLRVLQLRVNHRARITGKSKYNIHNRIVRTLADLLAIMWMKRRTLRFRVTEEE